MSYFLLHVTIWMNLTNVMLTKETSRQKKTDLQAKWSREGRSQKGLLVCAGNLTRVVITNFSNCTFYGLCILVLFLNELSKTQHKAGQTSVVRRALSWGIQKEGLLGTRSELPLSVLDIVLSNLSCKGFLQLQ